MKKIGIFLAVLPFLTACYTTNDVFTPDPSQLAKPSHELTLSTTLPFIALPQNIGVNYRFSTPLPAGSNWQLNAFARYEHGRKMIAEFEAGGGDSGGSTTERFRSDNAKVMIMPSYHLTEEMQLGMGFGLEYLDFTNPPGGASAMFLPMFNLNLGKITRYDEKCINSWNFNLSICDRWDKMAGVGHSTYYSLSDSLTHHFFNDAGSSVIWKSFKWSFTHEKKLENGSAVSLLFRFDTGITILGDFRKSFEKTIDRQKYPVFEYTSYKGFDIPFGFSMGLKF